MPKIPLMRISNPGIWHQRPWYVIENFSNQIIDYAKRLQDEEASLYQVVNDDNIIFSQITASSIKSSFAIEEEYLDYDSLLSSLIKSLNLDISSGIKAIDDSEREENAVRMTISLLNNMPLTLSAITKAHGLLSYNSAFGRFRENGEEVVVANRKTGEIFFEGVPPYLVNSIMSDIISWWNDERARMPSPLGSLAAHYIFVCIHPFVDGNGRTARAIGEKALIANDKQIFRPYSIASSVLSNRGRYYAAIGSHDPYEYPRFMLGMHKEAIQKGFQKAQAYLDLEDLFSRTYLSLEEKAILKTGFLRDDLTVTREHTSKFDDGYQIWDSFVAKGILDVTGRINLKWRPKTASNPKEAQDESSEEDPFPSP